VGSIVGYTEIRCSIFVVVLLHRSFLLLSFLRVVPVRSTLTSTSAPPQTDPRAPPLGSLQPHALLASQDPRPSVAPTTAHSYPACHPDSAAHAPHAPGSTAPHTPPQGSTAPPPPPAPRPPQTPTPGPSANTPCAVLVPMLPRRTRAGVLQRVPA
jgi:hypothetical protein